MDTRLLAPALIGIMASVWASAACAQNQNWIFNAGAATGNSPSISGQGADANISLLLTPKGTGNTVFSSGNVGIGTASPGYSLDIIPSGTTANIRLLPATWSSASDYAQIIMGDPNHTIKTSYGVGTQINDAQGIFLTGGNVGVGTTSAGSSLTVSGSATSTLQVGTGGFVSSGVNSTIVLTGYNTSVPTVQINSYDNGAAGTDLNLVTNGVSRLTILNGGNVGIGTAAPQATLDVNGFARLKLNSAAPTTCSASDQGAIALTHLAQECVCDTTPQWSFMNTSTACSW